MKNALVVLSLFAALLAATTNAEAFGVTIQRVRGELAAAEEGAESAGRFALTAITSGTRGGEKLLVFVEGLDTEAAYEVLLGDESGTFGFGTIEFRGTSGYGAYRFSSFRDEYPDGVTSLRDFSGKTVFVVDDSGETVLSGSIPDFVEPDSGDPTQDTFAVGAGLEALAAPSGAELRAAGIVTAIATNVLDHQRERLAIRAIGLDPDTEYGVFLTGGDEVSLGTFTPRGWLGIGRLVLDTSKGDTLPDHLAGLSGRGVEVRDPDGNVVLSGSVPSLK